MKLFLRISIIFFLILHLFSCASNDYESGMIGCYRLFDGWAGKPDRYMTRPFDYYYNKFNASLNLKILPFMNDPNSICSKTILRIYQSDLIGRMVSESINSSMQIKNEKEFDRIGTSLVKKYLKEKDKIQVKECRALYPNDPDKPNSGWKECECILYLHVSGGQETILKEAEELQKMNLL